jgi:hypothetical protein
VFVAVYGATDDLLGGLDDHIGDLATDLTHGRLALPIYLLAGALDDAVALLAGLPLGTLALGFGLLAGLVQYAASLAAGLFDLAPVLGQELAGFGARLLRLVYGLFDLGLAVLDLLPDRRVDVPNQQEQQDEKGYDLPEDQAGIAQVEDPRRVQLC